MPFPWLALATIGSSLVGAGASMWGNDKAEDAQTASNALQILEAQKNRDFQERMRDTAHQAEVKDLIAAGLNPILSAGGSGAASPSGSLPTVYSTGSQYSNTGSNVANAIATGISNARLISETNVNNAIIDRETSQAALNSANAKAAKIAADREEILFNIEIDNPSLFLKNAAGRNTTNLPGIAVTGIEGLGKTILDNIDDYKARKRAADRNVGSAVSRFTNQGFRNVPRKR